ncbi:MAG: glycosyl hydrolase [Planctomycetota bacterium]
MPHLALALATSFVLTTSETPIAGPAPREENAGVAARRMAWERHSEMAAESIFRGLEWRCVGPVVQGGRLVDIEVTPGEPYTFYVAYASGGLWRTVNNGVTFEPLFDQQPTIIMGDVALDPNDKNTIWVGTGENNSSRSSYGGMGVFRSSDGGRTWSSMGLADSDRIGRIVIDPRNSRRVYVAALGRLYTPGGERGIYRTLNGGASWERVLAGDDWTGFIDLVIDPSDPDVLYAASWERQRRPWNLVEGGAGSGLWKTTNGGDTWQRLSGGFPAGPNVGRIGLALAPSQPRTLYAVLDNQEPLPEEQWDLGTSAVTPKRLRKMSREEFLQQDPEEIGDFLRSYGFDPSLTAEKVIEQVKSGELTLEDLLQHCLDANAELFETDIRGAEVYRSDDGGATWRRTHAEPLRDVVHTYGYYFGQIRVSPTDPDRVYVLGVPLITSADGGVTFEPVNMRGVHGDHQALYVDPTFPGRLIDGNDGGLNMSFDGGKSFLKLNSTPVGQFYTVAVDMAEPYNIYGGLQDNGIMKGSSRSRLGGDDWEFVGGGDGMYVQIDPRDNETVYFGSQFGHYSRRGPGGGGSVRPRAAFKEPPLRYNWCTPIQLSSHNADIVYFGTQKLFRSMDQGKTWTAISEDLSRSTERGNVPFGTITTLAESSKRFGLIWAGTDDGLVYVTRDGGVIWNDVSGSLPSSRWVTRVEPSRHDEKAAYVSFSGYRDDDPAVYLYRTADLGTTWTSIGAGLPAEPVNVIREDPAHPHILYVGTDRSAYVSLDRGRSWHALAGGLPNVPVHDLVVHPRENELVAGTHGRSVWVLDVKPLQGLTEEVRAKPLHIFLVESFSYRSGWKHRRSPWSWRADREPALTVTYWTAVGGQGLFELRDEEGNVLREQSFDALRGINTVRWDYLLDEEKALAVEKARLEKAEKKEEPLWKTAPWAYAKSLGRLLYITPGNYKIRLQIGEASEETKLEVKKGR